jgi:serine protease Do
VTLNKEVSYQQLIQTQTPINPGNSGGPLFNKKGELVGVNVAIRAGAQNIAFAIPVDSMITKAADLLASRRKVALRNGMILADKAKRDGEDGMVKRWVVVAGVEPDSLAAASGFKTGDIIDRAGDITVKTTIDVERAYIDRAINSKMDFQVLRGTTTETCTMTLSGAMPAPTGIAGVGAAPGNNTANAAVDQVWKKLGLKATPVAAAMVSNVEPLLRGGMYLSEVAAGSSAARGGLAKGDIIVGLHLWESLSNEYITYVLNHKDVASFSPIKTYYIRGGKLREAYLTPE